MNIILLGETGVGKRTIARILKSTEGFEIISIKDADLLNYKDKNAIPLNYDEYFTEYMLKRSHYDRMTTDICLLIRRNSIDDSYITSNTIIMDNILKTIDNDDIVKTIKDIVLVNEYATDIYNYYYGDEND